ncbi:MAG: UPF0146 family protein [Thermoplasmatota archaeon]
MTLAAGRKVIEVGAGQDFRYAQAFARGGADPVFVLDVTDSVLQAPAPLAAGIDDITRPNLALYVGSGLVYGVRMPEELQVSAYAVARAVGASFALRVFNGEIAAGLGNGGRAFPHAWRVWTPATEP